MITVSSWHRTNVSGDKKWIVTFYLVLIFIYLTGKQNDVFVVFYHIRGDSVPFQAFTEIFTTSNGTKTHSLTAKSMIWLLPSLFPMFAMFSEP